MSHAKFTDDLESFKTHIKSLTLDDNTVIELTATVVAVNKKELFDHLWGVITPTQQQLISELIRIDGEKVDWLSVTTSAHPHDEKEEMGRLIEEALGSDDDDDQSVDDDVYKVIEDTLRTSWNMQSSDEEEDGDDDIEALVAKALETSANATTCSYDDEYNFGF